MTTIDAVAEVVHEWAKANKDALPKWPERIAGGPLPDGTVAGVTFLPHADPDEYSRVEQRPMLVYRLQRDGVFAATPFTVEFASDGIETVRFVHRSTERELEKMKQRHAGTT